jgi:hypothetical protein
MCLSRVFPLFALICALALSGCASDAERNSGAVQSRSLKDRLAAMVGLPETQLYAALGTPTRSLPTQDGGRIVEFVESQTSTVMTGTQVTSDDCSQSTNPQCLNFITGVRPQYATSESVCRMSFVLDRTGIVRSYNFKGDLC